ncbi:hypothetical protein BGZ81_006297 [Podila clonocystis]|nr:hypothetical protein BGZ81_006297 [Podila clonocystis]
MVDCQCTFCKNAHFITDPFTGASWLFGGQLPDASYVIEMDKFQDDTWTVTFPVIPAPTLVPAHYFGGTAHIYRNKIFNFGGIKATESRGYQSFGNLSYIDISLWPPVLGWRETLGEIPPERAYHCSVLTSSRKVIIFGGYDFMTKMTLQDVWSLDMLTSTWTQIITTNPPRPRYGHNCDIAGANMIVYGGMANNTHGYPQDIQIYDVMLSTWMASYTPKLDTAPVPQPHHEYLDSSGSPGIGIGSIISIIAAVLVVVACILGFIFYKHRQKQNDIHETEMEKKAYLASMRPEGGHSFGSQSALYNPLDVA